MVTNVLFIAILLVFISIAHGKILAKEEVEEKELKELVKEEGVEEREIKKIEKRHKA